MKYKTHEVINAMQILQETCEEHGTCTCCPLKNSFNKCELNFDKPKNWWITGGLLGSV